MGPHHCSLVINVHLKPTASHGQDQYNWVRALKSCRTGVRLKMALTDTAWVTPRAPVPAWQMAPMKRPFGGPAGALITDPAPPSRVQAPEVF